MDENVSKKTISNGDDVYYGDRLSAGQSDCCKGGLGWQ